MKIAIVHCGISLFSIYTNYSFTDYLNILYELEKFCIQQKSYGFITWYSATSMHICKK
jgi:hypothetical protein